MTAQGPELRALADTLREAGERATEGPWEAFEEGDGTYEVNGPATRPRPGTVARAVVIPKVWLSDVGLIVLLRNNLLTIISALERAAAAEGEHPEAETGECQCPTCEGEHTCAACLAVEIAEGEKAEACPTCTPQTGIWVRHERTCATEREADWW